MSQRRKVIIGIHGRGKQVTMTQLQADWQKAILQGLSKEVTLPVGMPEMVYYANIYYATPRYEEFISPNDVRHAVAIVFPDWRDYQSNLSVRSAFQKKLTDVLDKHVDDDVFLVAHSLGSVIAYDVLSQGNYSIHTLVTIGSALNVDAPNQARQKPAAVGDWYNLLSDSDNVVGSPVFAEAINYAVATKGHDAVYYLGSSRLGELLAQFLLTPTPALTTRATPATPSTRKNSDPITPRTPSTPQLARENSNFVTPAKALYTPTTTYPRYGLSLSSPLNYPESPLYRYVCTKCNFLNLTHYRLIGWSCPVCFFEMTQL